MYEATVEYRYPIAKKIQGVVFTDVGNAWGGVENIPWYHENNKLHYSGGIGFRITTPIGPIRLDYGVGRMAASSTSALAVSSKTMKGRG